MSRDSTADEERVRSALLRAAQDAYEDAAMRGLCCEGAWEVALSAMRNLDLSAALATAPPSRAG